MYMDNRLLHGPWLFNDIVLLENSHKKTELHQRKITIEKESKTSPSCSLKSTMKQKKEIKRERAVTYAKLL